MADCSSSQFTHFKTSMFCHQNVYKHLLHLRKALADLQEKSRREVLEDTSFWKKELKKVEEETNQAWQTKLESMETRLDSQEQELHRLQDENEYLQRNLADSQTGGSPTCWHCNSDYNQNGVSRIDSAIEDEELMKPSISECDMLQQRLIQEEQRADQLNLMHNQKLIELNKLQINLSNQTKEIMELEKAYLQLQYRLRRGTSKPIIERICSQTSPFSSKNLCHKPSPPASTQSENIISP